MQIVVDTENLTLADRQILTAMVMITGGGKLPTLPGGTGVETEDDTPAPAKKATPAPAKKAAAKKAAAKPEPEEADESGDEAEDLLGGGPTMADAVAAATKLVSSGQAAVVKEALSKVGAARVSELQSDDIAAFIEALG